MSDRTSGGNDSPGPSDGAVGADARDTGLGAILVDGRPVAVGPDQTVAAALLAAGIRSWRTTRKGRPRGLFCGIGVCFDCLVTVNGRRSVRACLAPARPGDVVTTGATRAPETSPAPEADPPQVEEPADQPVGRPAEDAVASVEHSDA